MDQIELLANNREILGKKVKSLRLQGVTPANLYGHNIKSTAIQVDTLTLKHTIAKAGKSSLIALKVDGEKRPKMVIVRDIQRHPLSGDFLHVDFYQVKMAEKVKLEVSLLFIGEAPAVKELDGILLQNLSSVEVECLPADMPHNIEVDISRLMEIDQALHVKDLTVSERVTILTDLEKVIAVVTARRVEVIEEVPEFEAEIEEEEGKEEVAEVTEEAQEE